MSVQGMGCVVERRSDDVCRGLNNNNTWCAGLCLTDWKDVHKRARKER